MYCSAACERRANATAAMPLCAPPAVAALTALAGNLQQRPTAGGGACWWCRACWRACSRRTAAGVVPDKGKSRSMLITEPLFGRMSLGAAAAQSLASKAPTPRGRPRQPQSPPLRQGSRPSSSHTRERSLLFACCAEIQLLTSVCELVIAT